jgi:uncharacterized protein YjgD (DUF1641 family)
MATCPNKAHPDFKILEARYGKRGAIKKYIENGYEIPVPENVSVRSIFSGLGIKFNSRDTMQALNKNPEMGQKIVDSLKKLYPKVRIYKDGLFDKNGNWRAIAPGEKGMHYRNAFQGAVAWANDAFLETPPHEYAHEYVDMFQDTPIVKKGIKKYGKEQLVKRMGAYYAGRVMSNSFQKFVQDFWNTIKSLMGSSDVADVLSSHFYKGKKLDGPIHKGTEIFSFQESNKPFKRTNGGINSNGKYNSVEKAVTNASLMNIEDAKKEIVGDLWAKEVFDPDSKGFNLEGLREFVRDTKDRIISTDRIIQDGVSKYKNSALLDTRLLNNMVKTLKGSDSLSKLGKSLLNEEFKELSNEEKSAIDTFITTYRVLKYKQIFKSSMADGNGNLVDSELIIDSIKESIENTAERRKQIFNKLKNPTLKKMAKWLERVSSQLQNNLRTNSSYLSGGENTELSDLVYKAIDQAGIEYHRTRQNFDDAMETVEKIPGYNKWSAFENKDLNINELETVDVKVKNKENPVKLTKLEALTLYLNLRQKTSNIAINQYGFSLDEQLKGRDIKTTEDLQFAPLKSKEFMQEMESDSKIMEVVERIDIALDGLYEVVNKTFKQENGYDLPKNKFYFPVMAGKQSIGQRISKSTISDYKAGYAQLGQSEALRIGDAMRILTYAKNSGALYSAYALPISNVRKLVKALQSEYKGEQEAEYFDAIEGTMKIIEDSSSLYSSQGAEKFAKAINNMTSNFAVSVLAMNVGVMVKQPISYLTAMEVIDKKFLKMAGWGVGGIVGIGIKDVIKSLEYTGVKAGETSLPFEWNMDKENPIYEEIKKHSPKLRARFDGMISKEAGEALMNREIGSDKIKIPFWTKKDGTKVTISKARTMEGIKIFDSATIMALWKAAKFEASEYHSELNPNAKEGSQEYNEYWEHIEGRVNEIVNKSQPTYDAANASGLSNMKDPIARVFSMFSSARQKVAMLLIDGVVKYVNNPSAENKAKLFKRVLNVGVTTSMAMTLIEMLKMATFYGMDDDEIESFITYSIINNNMSYFYGIGNLTALVTSQMDDKPWHKNMQHPFEVAVQETSQALSHIFKGNWDKAFNKSLDVTLKTLGLPTSAKTYSKAAIRMAMEEE